MVIINGQFIGTKKKKNSINGSMHGAADAAKQTQ